MKVLKSIQYYVEEKNTPPLKFGKQTYKWHRVNWPVIKTLDEAEEVKKRMEKNYKGTYRIVRASITKSIQITVVK